MKAWKDMMKKENLVVLLILGLLLLVLALPTEKTDRQNAKKEVETAQTGTAENWQQEMERQLQEILEQVEGVGETRVFLTCQSSSRKIVERTKRNGSMKRMQRARNSLMWLLRNTPG